MATIIGTEGNDTLTETAGVDTIDALGGDDTVTFDQAGSATETANGGAGSDRLIIDARGTNAASGVGNSTASLAGRTIAHSNFEHFTVYNDPNVIISPGGMNTGDGNDVYHYTAINDQSSHISKVAFIYLGGGDDRIVIDGTGVTAFELRSTFDGVFGAFWVGAGKRLEIWQVEHLDIVGGSLDDTLSGLSGSDVLEGRDGNDMLNGLGGDDRLIGGNGNDTLDGGGGNDVLVAGFGADTVIATGETGTSDWLEIDARTVMSAVSLTVSGPGSDYSGNTGYSGYFSWSAGSIDYSFVEGFIVYSNPGSFADNVTTGDGDDVFHHYGINDLSYLMDTVDLGGGTNDLLVADFSAVTDHAVARGESPLPNGHFLFTVGGNGKIEFTGVERIHFTGGAQGDTVFGLAGDDILAGGGGGDQLYGREGDDDLSAGTGSGNQVDGGDGDDVLRFVSLGQAFAIGGDGFDTAIIDYSGETANVTNSSGGTIAYSNSGLSNVVLSGVERIVITTGSGNDSIVTLGGDDEIRTGAGTDSLNGEGGNDYLDGGSGADSMAGLAGNDIYIVDDINDQIIDDSPTGGTDTVYASAATYTLPTGVENIIAVGGHAHNLRGNGGDNGMTGEAGADFLLLQDGGADEAYGLVGNDVVYFGAAYTGDDFADGGAGRDAFVLQGNYAMTLNGSKVVGFESISLQSGANTQFGDTSNNFYDYDVTTTNDLVTAGQQMIVNAQSLRAGEDFTFDGSAETDGRFLIYGGHGVDDLTGGALVDVFFFEGSRWGASDKVNGGGGRDALVISAGSGLTHIEFAADSLTSIESISLNNFYATDPTQIPSYELVLHNGNVAPGGTLIVNGNSLGAGQVANIDGSAVEDGHLMLFGGGGNDAITGGDGNDLLLGAGGGDTLTGGAGADTFRYDSTTDSSAGLPDLIEDFQTGADKIDLSRIDANAFVGGDQAFTWIGSSAFSGSGAASAGQLRVYADDGYQMIEGDTNGDGAADFSIVLQVGTAPIVSGDFLL